MKKLFTLLSCFFLLIAAKAQTTEYTTGQTYADAWTGWSTPVVTGTTGSNINGVNMYIFSGTNGVAHTIEIYRQFTINSNDLDLYLAATTQGTTVSVLYSTDNISYSEIGSQVWAPIPFSQSTIVIPTFDPVVSTFYLKLKIVGTFGGSGQSIFNSLKIDAVLNAGNSVSIAPTSTQNILTSANGTVLSSTEIPSAATSREWKYSLTSGSGYVSFGTAQTGTTYTPNFAVADVYYVVCVSNFAGDMQTSNEVQINVTAPASIDEFKIGAAVSYANGIMKINSGLQNYTVQIFDIHGQLIEQHANLKTFDFAEYNNGIYFVSIYYMNERRTLKIAHVN